MRTIVGQVLSLLATGILAVGDFGVGGARERATGEAMRAFEQRHPAQLLVTLGDNDYTRSPRAFAPAWRASFGWLPSAGVDVAGALGNHDVEIERGRYQFALLGMPASYYTRDVGDVRVFVLDSTAITPAQTQWLRWELAASAQRWKVVVFHHPAYACGGYFGNAAVQQEWRPLFERYRVSLVLNGHDHNYQRFASRRRVTYVVHGGGGAPLYRLARCPSSYPRRLAARSARGFLYLTASPRALVVRAVSLAGRIVDRVTIPAAGAVQRS